LWLNLDLTLVVIGERLGCGQATLRERAKVLGLPSRGDLRDRNRKAA
jgi:hypothetical protein